MFVFDTNRSGGAGGGGIFLFFGNGHWFLEVHTKGKEINRWRKLLACVPVAWDACITHCSAWVESLLLCFESSFLPLSIFGRQRMMADVLEPCHPHRRSGLSAGCLASAGSSTGYCGHLENELTDGRSKYICL